MESIGDWLLARFDELGWNRGGRVASAELFERGHKSKESRKSWYNSVSSHRPTSPRASFQGML
jgi:hypothetical protein